MQRPLFLALLMVSASLAGCFGDEGEDVAESSDESDDSFRPYTVIAPIDTGINPYHDHFQTDEILPDWFIAVSYTHLTLPTKRIV